MTIRKPELVQKGILLLFACLFAVLVAASPAWAQSGSQGGGESAQGGDISAGSVSLDKLKNLRSTLTDPKEREALLSQIDTLIAVRESQEKGEDGEDKPAEGLLGHVSERVDAIGEEVTGLAMDLAQLPRMVLATWQRAGDPTELLNWLRETAKMAAVLALAILCAIVGRRLTRKARSAVAATGVSSWFFSVFAYLLHFILALVPTMIFLAVAYAVIPATGMAEETRTLTLLLINALALVHAITLTATELFHPPSSLPAPFRLPDESAAYATVWTRRFAVIAVYGFFITDALSTFGLPDASIGILERAVGLLVAGMAVVLIMQLKNRVAEWLRKGAEPKSMRAKLARTWHYLALLAVAIFTAVGLLGTADSFAEVSRSLLGSLIVFFVAALASQGVNAVLKRIFNLSRELSQLHPRLEARANRYIPVLRKAMKGLVYILALLALMQVWGLGGFQWLGSEAGRSVGGLVLSIAFTLVGALVVWEVITTLIEDALERASPDLDAAAIQRRQTLLPLAKNVLRLTLIVLVTLIAFSELGINIAPLLAGAGVIGLAIGFGAQSLVQDLITGVFILVENTIAVGDFVELAGYAGTVESMSIRSIRLRDLEGNVHTIPFSEVSTVHNMTDKYAYALIDIGVAYRENVDDVLALLKELGDELKADETWGRDILEDIEIFGLNDIADSAVELRVRFKVVAGRQWAMRREFLRRVKQVFDDREVEIPYPHRTLYFGMDKQGEAPPARVLIDESGQSPPPEGDVSPGGPTPETGRGSDKGELGDAQ